MRTITLLVSAMACTGSLAQTELASPHIEKLIFEHVHLIDGVSPQVLRDVTEVVQGGRIESISSGPVQDSAGTRVIDLGGR